MENLLGVAGAAVAVIVSIVGLFVTIDQLTVQSRLRKRIEWTNELLAVESDPIRQRLLEHIRTQAASRIAASALVPGLYFAEAALWLILAPVVFVSATRDNPTLSSVAASASLIFVVLVSTVRRSIRIYFERRRIALEYAAAAEEISLPKLSMIDLMEGGVRAEFGYAVLFSLGVAFTGAGSAILLADIAHEGIGVTALVVGLALGWGSLNIVRARARAQ